MVDQPVGLRFAETMTGGFALGATDPHGGARLGKVAASPMTTRCQVTIASVDEFLADPDHRAAVAIELDFAPLGVKIACDPGQLQLLRQSDDETIKVVTYACGFTAGGERYFLEGERCLHDGVPLHTLLDQAMTLYATLYQGDAATGAPVGAGVLQLGLTGVIDLVASMRTIDAPDLEASAAAIAAFGELYLGALWQSYAAYVSGDEAAYVARPTGGARTAVKPRAPLAFPAGDLQDGATATVVVIGSGYGGGVAASRLARAGQNVVVLERGKEWRAGDFPTNPLEAAAQLQIDGPDGRLGARTGLYDLRANAEVDVVVGCGLGGTSLINANVSLEPVAEVFDNPRWPQAIRDDRTTLLADGYARARAMLQPNPYPPSAPALPKLQALARSADAIGRPFARAPINVAFEHKLSGGGVPQSACTLCGDCVTGCNYNAKTTVDMTFLPDAKAHGADLYTEVTVRWIERDGDKFRVVWRWTEASDDAALRVITADVVVLAAGVLGSTELLLRSAEHGLAVSSLVGRELSANGDYLSFAYNNNAVVHGIGCGDRPIAQIGPVGPTITGVIEPAAGQALEDQYIIEEGAIPGAFADALPLAFAVAAATIGTNTATSLQSRLDQAGRALESLALGGAGAYVGAVDNTQTFLTIGHDSADGTMALVGDRLRIAWPGAGEQPIYDAMQATTVAATAITEGIAIKEPVWTDVLHHNLITVHPLGGCPMGEDAARGVVNDRGQVFAGTTGTAVHAGLYVADGSIVPTSLGVNPLLTISALAERAMTLLIRDRGWNAG